MLKDIEMIYVLSQILIILFPIFLYQFFFPNESPEQRKRPFSKLIILLFGMVFLAMSFPVKFAEGYIYDFRSVPFIMSFMYGGIVPGLLVYAEIILYRLWIGGEGFYHIVLCYTSALLIFGVAEFQFERMGIRKKVFIASSLHWFLTFMLVFSFLDSGQYAQIPFIFMYYTVAWICLVITVYIFENMNQQRIMQKELQRAEKLNVISQLAAAVAHEVRNPMTSVRGFLQLMMEERQMSDAQKNYAEIAIDELDHAQEIINDYLSLARPNHDGAVLINLSLEVQKTIDLMASYSHICDITIKTDIQQGLFILGNQGEIKQVLINIMKNGIEAMEKDGVLKVAAYVEAASVVIEIADTGRGMNKKQLQQIGTPFYTTKEKGTGIGLTICFQLIHAMKGKINVDSEPGKGTLFKLILPMANVL